MKTLGDLVRLGDLRFSDGYRTKQAELSTRGFRILRAGDIGSGRIRPDGPDFVDVRYERSIGEKVARLGDVVLTTKGTVGRVATVRELDHPLVYSPQLCFFRVLNRQRLNPEYLHYWLMGPEFTRQSGFMMGATDMAPYLSLKDLASVTIDLPHTEAQRAIAEVLGALDDKIAAIARGDALAASLSELLFAKACSATGAKELPLWDAIRIRFGEPFSGEMFTPAGSGRPLIRIRDLKTHRCQVWTSESRSAESLINAGDVVAGMDAEFRPSYWLGDPGVLNQRCLVAESDIGGKSFALEALKAPLARVEASKSATTVIHLNKSDLLRETVTMPAAQELDRFVAQSDSLRLKRVAWARESDTLAALRDTLLPHLMSGRLTVRQAEAAVSDAL